MTDTEEQNSLMNLVTQYSFSYCPKEQDTISTLNCIKLRTTAERTSILSDAGSNIYIS